MSNEMENLFTLSLICLMVIPQAIEMNNLSGVNDSTVLMGSSRRVRRMSGYPFTSKKNPYFDSEDNNIARIHQTLDGIVNHNSNRLEVVDSRLADIEHVDTVVCEGVGF